MLLLSCSVMSNSSQPRGLQHTRLLWPSLSPGICSSSGPMNQWYQPTISPSVTFFSFCLQSFLASGSLPIVSCSHQVAKVLELQLQHQSFQRVFRVISFKIDCFDRLAFQGTLKSLLQKHSSKVSIPQIHTYIPYMHSHILIGSKSYKWRERTTQLEKYVNSLSNFENYHVQHTLIGSIRILIMKTWKVVWQAEIWWP